MSSSHHREEDSDDDDARDEETRSGRANLTKTDIADEIDDQTNQEQDDARKTNKAPSSSDDEIQPPYRAVALDSLPHSSGGNGCRSPVLMIDQPLEIKRAPLDATTTNNSNANNTTSTQTAARAELPLPPLTLRPLRRSLSSSGTESSRETMAHRQSFTFGLQRHSSIETSTPSLYDSSGTTEPHWNIRVENLGPVPTDFPLERTHRAVDSPPDQVASRISKALQRLSVQTEYDCDNCKAKCETADSCRFRIRLYAENESGQPVIVEVQKRSGQTRTFMQSYRSILAAAEGNEATESNKSNTNSQRTYKRPLKPISEMKCLEKARAANGAAAGVGVVGSDLPTSNNNNNRMMMTSNGARPPLPSLLTDGVWNKLVEMIHNKDNRKDLVLLGLEKLSCLTDPQRTEAATARHAAQKVLDDLDLVGIVYIRFEVEEAQDAHVAKHDEAARLECLQILANSLSLLVATPKNTDANADPSTTHGVSTNHKMNGALSSQPPLLEDRVVDGLCDVLLEELRSSTHRAHLAASCWNSLLSSADPALQRHIQARHAAECRDLLREAQAVGERSHALLEEEARRGLEKLDSGIVW